jgi:hypothetical protein
MRIWKKVPVVSRTARPVTWGRAGGLFWRDLEYMEDAPECNQAASVPVGSIPALATGSEQGLGRENAGFDMNPKIVCLCGSTRFYDAFQEANYRETMAGNIVLSVGHYPNSLEHGGTFGCTPEEKVKLDKLHFRKIELADEIFVLNVGGYIGESTRNEIEHAKKLDRVVKYLETP